MKIPLKLQLQITLNATIQVLKSPWYLLISIFACLAIIAVMLWSLNLNLLGYILFEANLPLGEKISFFTYAYQSLFTNINDIFSASIVVFALLFGTNTALLTKAIRQNGLRSAPKKGGLGATGAAILSGGCVACGTSIVAPIISSLGASSSALLLRDLGTIITILGIVFLLYSIYKLAVIIPR